MNLRKSLSLSLFGLVFTASAVYALEVNTEGLGKLEIGGALSGYLLSGDQKITEENRKSRTDLSSALISVSKKGEFFSFTLQGGAYAFPTIGMPLSKTSDFTDMFSPLPLAYVELNLAKNLTLSAGRLGTLIGYEALFTYQNNYIQRGLVWNMQPLFHHGIRLTWVKGPFTIKGGLNDGYFSAGVDSFTHDRTVTPKISPALEFSTSLEVSKNFNLALNLLLPKKSSLPNEVAYPANKREYNMVLNFVRGNMTLGFDGLFVDAPRSYKAQVSKSAKAYGFALHGAYDLSPIKIALRFEYVKDKKDAGSIDLVGLGDGNRAYTLTLSPGYYKDPLFFKADLSYVKAKEDFTYKEKDKLWRFGLEAGFRF